jgi:hypothetical protein
MPPLLPLLLFAALLGCAPALAQEEAILPEREALQERINGAIDKGVGYLLRAQNRDGSWGPVGGRLQEGHFDRRYGHSGLAVYALLKSGVKPSHPAVKRGIAYMLGGSPTKVYSAACEMMALGATGDERYQRRIEELLDLIESLRKRGVGNAWGYPGLNGGHVDLSNTQYAALGMRAAQGAGVKVSSRSWASLIDTVLEFQHPVHVVEERSGETPSTLHKVKVAAFSYDRARSGGGHAPSGSMTAAGVSILGICAEAYGSKLSGAAGRRLARACEYGIAWLGHSFSVAENIGGSPSWLYYYLYGLERVGALFDLDRIGRHEWYWEGARFLVDDQGPNGRWETEGDANWPPAPMTNGNTCFALLFLTRATVARPSTGKGVVETRGLYRAEDAGSEVWIRASGSAVLTAWVTGFGDSVLARYVDEAAGVGGLRVEAVEWFIDGVRVARVEADPERAWDSGAKLPLRYAFEKAGTHTLQARAEVVVPAGVARDADPLPSVLRSAELKIAADDVLEGWMMEYASAGGFNELEGYGAVASASSQLEGRWSASRAIDGMQFSPWISSEEDEQPTITIELRRSFRADRVLLSQVNACLEENGRKARVDRVGIVVNRSREVLEFDLEQDERLKTVCRLPKTVGIRRIEIRILERSPGLTSRAAGFAEVMLGGP